MLTKSELQWIKDREENNKNYGAYYCTHCTRNCSYKNIEDGEYYDDEIDCEILDACSDYVDAAKFEAMVVQEMAFNAIKVLPASLAEIGESVGERLQMKGLVFISRLSAEENLKTWHPM